MLLNFCMHTALTFSVFAGGINHTKYPGLCQAVSPVPHSPKAPHCAGGKPGDLLDW